MYKFISYALNFTMIKIYVNPFKNLYCIRKQDLEMVLYNSRLPQFAGLGVKLLGQQYFFHNRGGKDASLFHLSSQKILNRLIERSTGIEDQTAPGVLPKMEKAALQEFKNRPVILAHDERSVSCLYLIVSIIIHIIIIYTHTLYNGSENFTRLFK